MATRRTATATSSSSSSSSSSTPKKEDLLWFQERRNRWLNADRPKIKPLPPTSPDFSYKALPVTATVTAAVGGVVFVSTGGSPHSTPTDGGGGVASPIGAAFSFGKSDGGEDDDDDDDDDDEERDHPVAEDNIETLARQASTLPFSSSAFPPLSTKAPTPFGGTETGQSTKETSFGFGEPTTKSKTTPTAPGLFSMSPTSFALPTTSSNDATSFSFGTLKTQTSSILATAVDSKPSETDDPKVASHPTSISRSSDAFPPMATKAPTPFGSSGTVTNVGTTPGVPTTKSLLTTPFGKKDDTTKPSPTLSVAPSSSAAGAAFPPMSTKAPTPFGSLGVVARAKPGTGEAAAKSTVFSSSTTAALPPMASKAPTPFGSQATEARKMTTTPTTSVKSSSASYPPMSRTAPKAHSFNTTTPSNNKDYKSRLIDFYKKHNPSKLDSVDVTLDKYKGQEEDLFQKLQAKYEGGPSTSSANKYPLPAGNGPTCYLEFSIDGEAVPGRVVVELYQDKTPLACENFRCLCTGEKGPSKCYKNSKVHRIVPSFVVQLGDYTKGDGTGGSSIYAPGEKGANMWGKFKDEPFMQHSRPGLLSMANSGPNSNSSQFFVTLKATPHLNGKHTVFGEVKAGIDVIERIAKVQTNKKQYPLQPVVVTDCGEIKDGKDVPANTGTSATSSSTPFSSPKPSPFGGFAGFGSSSHNAPGSSKTPMSFSGLAATGNGGVSPAFGGFGQGTSLTSFGGNAFGGGTSNSGVGGSVFGSSTSIFGSKTLAGASNDASVSDSSTKSTAFSFGSTSSLGVNASPSVFGSNNNNNNNNISVTTTNTASPSFGELASGIGTNLEASLVGSGTSSSHSVTTTTSNAKPSPFAAFSNAKGGASSFSFGSQRASSPRDNAT